MLILSSTVVAQEYPLSISPNGRYLQDVSGTPFLMNGDAPWVLISGVTYADANSYMLDRTSRGFNTLLIELVEHEFGPINANGDNPFGARPFVDINEPYFAHADSVLERANELGLAVLLAPAYVGYACNSSGWCSEMVGRSGSEMKSWGRFIGNRYKHLPNIIWVIGGDTDPSPVQSKLDSVVAGILLSDTVYTRLFTTHNGRGTRATTNWPNRPWLNLNSAYVRYTTGTMYLEIDTAYMSTPTMPFFMIEGVYENEHNANPQQLRAQAYWSITRGAFGHVFGNCPIWHLGLDGGAGCGTINWRGALDDPGSVSMSMFHRLFLSRHWHRLIPDRNRSVLTAGTMSGASFATTAYASDSSSIIAYLPTARTVTVNPSRLRGDSIRVYWYNPSNGSVADSGTFAKSTRDYHQPFSGDWVLIIDGSAFFFPPPGAGAGVSLTSFNATITPSHHALLAWVTESEFNNLGFEVQRRREQGGAFLSIPGSFVLGHGTTDEPQYYAYLDTTVTQGPWRYRLKQISTDSLEWFGPEISLSIPTIVHSASWTPERFDLRQNFPNPFNGGTTIAFHLPAKSPVTITIYDALGKQIKVLSLGSLEAGVHEVFWDGSSGEGLVSSGVYLFRVRAGDEVLVGKMVTLK